MRFALVVIALVAAVQCAERTVQNSCPKSLLVSEGTKYLQVEGDLCYFFGTYAKKYYNDANNSCKRDGGLLAMPKSKTQNDYISDKLKNTYKEKSETWIGLNDKGNEGTFMWVDDTMMDWENFANNNGPHNDELLGATAKVEDCVAIHSDGKWHDYQCNRGAGYRFISWISGSDTKKYFVCQYPALELPKEEKKDEDNTGEQNDNKEDETKEDADSPDNDQDVVGGGEGDDNISPTAVQVDEGKNQTVSGNVDKDKDNNGTVSNNGCGAFQCDRDCGMNGFKINDDGCQRCECNFSE